jgi:hypothetical protein
MGTKEKFGRSWGCVTETKSGEMGVKGGPTVAQRRYGGAVVVVQRRYGGAMVV